MNCINFVVPMNPCRCGFYPDRSRCSCLPGEISRYLRRISWPLLDRIDICVETPRVEYQDLTGNSAKGAEGESSAQIRKRVEAAHRIQRIRYEGADWHFNSGLPSSALSDYCPLDRRGERVMEAAFERLGLSARAYHRILKVARTIADLEGEEKIREPHLLEAVGYRCVDQRFWENE